MINQVLVSPDVAPDEQVQVEVADGGGVRFIRVQGSSGGAGGGPLGAQAVGNSLAVEAIVPKTAVALGETVTLFTMPALAAVAGNVVAGPAALQNGEQTTWAVLVQITADTNTDQGHFEHRVTYFNDGLAVLNPQGTTTDTDVTSPPPNGNVGPSLVNVTVAITLTGATPILTVTAPDIAVHASASISLVRDCVAVSGPAPSLAGAVFTPSSGPTAGGTLVSVTGASGLLNGLIGIFTNGIAGTNYDVTSDTTMQFRTGAGTLGTGNIVLATQGGTATAVNAWTYANPIPVPITLGADQWWKADTGITVVAGNAQHAVDQTGDGNDMAGTVANTFTANDPAFNDTPSIQVADSASALGNTHTENQPLTIYLAGRVNGGGDCDIIGSDDLTSVHRVSFGSRGGNWYLYAGGGILTSGIAVDTAAHAFAIVVDGASSAVYMDDSTTPIIGPGDPGGNASQVAIGGATSVTASGFMAEAFYCPGAQSNAQIHTAFVYFTDRNIGIAAT